MSGPPNKGQKGSTSKKEFSKSLRPSKFPSMTSTSTRSPRKKSRSSPKEEESTLDKKADKKYSILIDDYTIKEIDKALVNADEIINVVQNNSNKKEYLAITCKESNNPIFNDYFRFQISILINNQHPTFAHIYGYSFNDFENKGRTTFLISHYQCVLSKLLFDKSCQINIQNYNSTKRQITLIGISRGMYLLHERCILHKRLNSDNIYINKHYYPKIIGFGGPKSEKDIYSAPEKTYSTKTDVYSFGILMYEILSGIKAYSKNKDQDKLFFKIINQNYRPVINFPIKSSLKNLMTQCWDSDPNKRPDFLEIFTKLCQLDGDETTSYCLDDDVDKKEVNDYIKKVLVDPKPANFGKEDEENELIKSLEEQLADLKNKMKLLNKEEENNGIIFNEKNEAIIPDSFTSIPGDCLQNKREIIRCVIIPKSVVMIESNAFNGCKSLEILNVPLSVKFIGDSSFSNCISLQDFLIPDSVDSLGLYAFSNCEKLEKIKLSSSLIIIKKGTFDRCYSLKFLKIPNSVKSLGEKAFSECKKLRNIVLSKSLTKIKDDAFANCEKLRFIEIPNSVNKIGSSIFYGCKQLKEVILSSKIDSFKESMFLDCKSLKSIKVEEKKTNVKSPRKVTFENNDNDDPEDNESPEEEELNEDQSENDDNPEDGSLDTLIVPPTIKTIEDNAFEGCKFKAIHFPSSVEMIGDNVCKGSKKLTFIKIDSPKATIKCDAFNGLISLEKIESNSSLTSVKIPLSVDKINGESFHLCISCQKIIEEDDQNLVHFSGFYYHKSCMKCSICHKKIQSIYMENFKYVAPGLIFCIDDYKKAFLEDNTIALLGEDNEIALLGEDNESEAPEENDENVVPEENNENEDPEEDNNEKVFLDKYNSIRNEYLEKIIYISIKELFSPFTYQSSNSSELFWIDQDLIDNSFHMNKDYQYFVPTVTFHLENEPEKIDFLELISELPKEMVIISAEEGSTLLTLALIILDDINASDLEKECREIIEKFKIKLKTYVQTVGNIIGQPKLKIPSKEEMEDFYDNEYNFLRHMHILKKVDLKRIKNIVKKKLSEEKDKNIQIIYNHFDIYKKAEKKVLHDIKKSKFECILNGITIIGNKYFDEYEEIRNQIEENKGEIIDDNLLYHGTNIVNHSKIIKEHFNMPGEDKSIPSPKRDDGFFGEGIYATNNFYYASMYKSQNFMELNPHEKASIFCCSTIYNNKHVIEAVPFGTENSESDDTEIVPAEDIDKDREILNLKNSYGIIHVLVGSINKFSAPINKDEEKRSRISAEEFIFLNKYQIIPVMSFTISKTDFYVLWADQDKKYSKILQKLKHRIKENIYYFGSNDEYSKCVDKRLWNKMKLIISCHDVQWGIDIINDIRNKIESNFMCLVFSNDPNQVNSFNNIENVLFTTNDEKLINFAGMDIEDTNIKNPKILNPNIEKFISDLENDGFTFKINKESIATFKIIESLQKKEKPED